MNKKQIKKIIISSLMLYNFLSPFELVHAMENASCNLLEVKNKQMKCEDENENKVDNFDRVLNSDKSDEYKKLLEYYTFNLCKKNRRTLLMNDVLDPFILPGTPEMLKVQKSFKMPKHIKEEEKTRADTMLPYLDDIFNTSKNDKIFKEFCKLTNHENEVNKLAFLFALRFIGEFYYHKLEPFPQTPTKQIEPSWWERLFENLLEDEELQRKKFERRVAYKGYINWWRNIYYSNCNCNCICSFGVPESPIRLIFKISFYIPCDKNVKFSNFEILKITRNKKIAQLGNSKVLKMKVTIEKPPIQFIMNAIKTKKNYKNKRMRLHLRKK